jgi:Tfp pilus assembly protein PilP
VKSLLVLLLIVSGCSTWKNKDFEKEMDKPSEEAQPKVETTTSEEKILEKFEVQPVTSAPAEQKPEAPKVTPPKTKTAPTKTTVKTPAKPAVIAPAVKSLPADYPPEMLAINEKAKKVWDLYKPNHYVDEKVYLDIHYLGMTVGKIMVLNKGKKMINNNEVWHLHARFKSAPFYSNIYELDDTVDTYVTTDKFLSSRYSLIQRESKQDIDDLQLHDRDQLKTFWFYHQKKSTGDVKDKKEEKFIPYFSIDPFSVLFLYQGLPLKDGDVYEIPLINKGKILILRSKIEGRENITTEKGTRSAIRIHATTQYTGETLKSGDLYFWFSNDNKRTLLKAQAKIKIGSVTADIVEK